MLKISIAIILLGLSLSGLSAKASQCFCVANAFSKTYDEKDGLVKTKWGAKRHWSCVYDCETPHGSVKIRGDHRKNYWGHDNGLWALCDGLEYTEVYNNYRQDFVWTYQRSVGLDPVKSTSLDLQKLAKSEQCQ